MGASFYIVDVDNPASVGSQPLSKGAFLSALREGSDRGGIVVQSSDKHVMESLRDIIWQVLSLVNAHERGKDGRNYPKDIIEDIRESPARRAKLKIDIATVALQNDFIEMFKTLDAATVHDRAGGEGADFGDTAAFWCANDRIIGLPWKGESLYPAFQFDEDGQPYPLLQGVLKALPNDWPAWQRAFWLVAPNKWLEDGGLPRDAIRSSDKDVLTAAEQAGIGTVG